MNNLKVFPSFWQAFFYLFLLPLAVIVPLLILFIYIFAWFSFDEWVEVERSLGHIYTLPVLAFFIWKSNVKIRCSDFTKINMVQFLQVFLLTIFSFCIFHFCVFFLKLQFQREYPVFVIPQLDFLSVLHALVLAPVVEEILYRRILLAQFVKQYPVWVAIVLSSFIFALLHAPVFMFPELLIPFFISGMFLGLIYYKTESLLLCVMAHFVMNLIEYLPFEYLPFFNGYSNLDVWGV